MGIRDFFNDAKPKRNKSGVSLAHSSTVLHTHIDDLVVPEAASPLRDDNSRLGRFVNVAFCGHKAVGKSKLINSLVQKHIAQERGRDHHLDGNRYLHPTLEDVALYEMAADYAARKDFRGFDLIVVVFLGSVTEADMEVVRRAVERDVEVIFVHSRGDQALDRQMRIAGLSEAAAVEAVRSLVNKHADKTWFQMKELHRKFYIVSAPALRARNDYRFDEEAFINRLERAFARKKVDENAETLTGLFSSTAVEQTAGTSLAGGRLRGDKSMFDSYSAVSSSVTAPSQVSSNATRSRSLLPISALQQPPGAGPSKIAFLEEIDMVSTTPTLMESFLGFVAGTDRTIAQNTPYKHPDYSNALFYSIGMEAASVKGLTAFFTNNYLHQMRLIIIVFRKNLRELDIALAKECKSYGVDVIYAQIPLEDAGSSQRSFSPRATMRKIKTFALTKDASSLLAKHHLNVPVFGVNPRILRIPESYPKTDEEEFKAYIATTCGGRTPPGTNRSTPTSASPGDPYLSPELTFRQGSIARSTAFVESTERTARTSRSQIPSRPALASSLRSPSLSPKGTPPSVTFSCRQEVYVAYVGVEGCGKSTLVRNTLGLRPDAVPAAQGRGPRPVRHPAHYDLMIQDYPGYDPSDPAVGTDSWIRRERLHNMDWIIIVFQNAITSAELAIARFAEHSHIPVIFVATKVDQLVERFIYDKNMAEKAAIEHTKYTIIQKYKTATEHYSWPIFLVVGRALERRRKQTKDFFDEAAYLEKIENGIAATFRQG